MDPSKTSSSSSQHEQQQHDPKSNEGNPLSKAADSLKTALNAHSAHPGPPIPKDFNVQQEGTKEERRAKAKELNKE
ncbi:hypothetical protein VTJ83DRAFT_1673 [Remersonia thermophila]|uniref:Uncharacterized protein n=1 Tax=Remersonia thermophila TaxID=72144 RepID=A0ABR4DIX7_9PEZI